MSSASLRPLAAAAALLLATSGAALAADAPAAPGGALPSGAMAWAATPTYADVVAAYPEKARAAHVGGYAVVYCEFSAGGRLSHCLPIAEKPLGEGFGTAAFKLTDKFRADFDARERQTHPGVNLAIAWTPAMLQGGQPVVGQPQWAELPTAADVDAAFAGTPKNVGTVRVVLNCKVEQGGGLGGCGVTSEQPAGVGFGKAALALAAKARVDTWTDQGLPVVGSEVRMPIRFETGAPAAAKP